MWTLLALPPLTLGGLILAFMAGAGIEPSGPGAEEAVRRALPWLIAVNHLGLFALLLFVLRRGGETLRDIGWATAAAGTTLAREAGTGVLCALGLYLFKELAADPVRQLLAGQTPTFTSLFAFRPAALDLPMALVATTLVFVEESIYRGFALPRLRERLGLGAAVAVTSVAFGLLHWGNGPFAVAFATIWGALLAVVFLWRGNLVAGTTAHGLYNLAVLLT